ncbi:MAG: NAD(P)/FAD-dependent oxidoreductase [Clostridiales bacterium]|nr:NAD(P)/FAD-dependent oxidoreductase [Clostridiales bacterium]
MLNKRQVIVVGSGPAGASAAFYLATNGVDVLMVDKETWPRDKVCGDSQAQNFVSKVYKDMGIYEEVQKVCGYGIRKAFYGGVKEDPAMFDFGGDLSNSFLLQRRIIDDMLRRGAMRVGADFLENFEVTEVIRERGFAKGIRGIYGGKLVELRADAVILANGSHNNLGKPFGIMHLDPELVYIAARGYFRNVRGAEPGCFEEHLVFPEMYPSGYFWSFLLRDDIANVGVFISEKSLIKSNCRLEDYITRWRDTTRIGGERLGESELIGEIKGWRLTTSREVRDDIYGNGILAVGDAGGHINCHSGGGFEFALQSGYAAGMTLPDLLKKGDVSREALRAFYELDAQLINPFMKINTAVHDKVSCDPEIYERFIAFAKEMPDYPNFDQYTAYCMFMMVEQDVDLTEECGIDLVAMNQQQANYEQLPSKL